VIWGWVIKNGGWIALALVLVGAAGWTYQRGYRNGAEAERSVYQEKLEEAGARFAAELERQQDVLATRDHELSILRARTFQQRETFEEVVRNDPQSRAWADSPLPDAIRMQLAAAQAGGHPELPGDTEHPDRAMPAPVPGDED